MAHGLAGGPNAAAQRTFAQSLCGSTQILGLTSATSSLREQPRAGSTNLRPLTNLAGWALGGCGLGGGPRGPSSQEQPRAGSTNLAPLTRLAARAWVS